MRHLPQLAVAQRAIRARVCPVCVQRPLRSESLGPSEPRSCEAQCPIFHNLPQMLGIAMQNRQAATLAPHQRAALERICLPCHDSPNPGDFCSRRSTADCPLSRQLSDVVDALERMMGAMSR